MFIEYKFGKLSVYFGSLESTVCERNQWKWIAREKTRILSMCGRTSKLINVCSTSSSSYSFSRFFVFQVKLNYSGWLYYQYQEINTLFHSRGKEKCRKKARKVKKNVGTFRLEPNLRTARAKTQNFSLIAVAM